MSDEERKLKIRDVLMHADYSNNGIEAWSLDRIVAELDNIYEEADIRFDELKRVRNGANEASRIITPFAGSREINYYDFDYYIYLRGCELTGEESLPTYEAYVESQR